MPATPERQSSNIEKGAAPTYSPDFLPLLQLLLATLADIDYEHESDIETVRNSPADEWLKQATIRKLQERRHQRRAPYVRKLEGLQKHIQVMAA
jgi:hypothetical protein